VNLNKKHIVLSGTSIRKALIKLNELSIDSILIVVDSNNKLTGSLTDGDIRRGLIKGASLDDNIDEIIQSNPKFLLSSKLDFNKLIEYREGNFKVIPIIDDDKKVVNIINFRKVKSYLPIDVVVMAGGKGKRLRPLTNVLPKPLLKIGEKTIIDHNLDRLSLFGVENFWVSINYLGEQIEKHLDNNPRIKFIKENKPLGTIGAVSKIKDFKSDYILVTNSDLLTNINYEQFFLEFTMQDADFAVLTIPYQVDIPYAVLETLNNEVIGNKEKPKYIYNSNGGVYLMKKRILDFIPKDKFYNATDLIDKLIQSSYKIISYPFTGYWLDIGKHEDFEKAQKDFFKINFE
jgi:dTDP-glucose pyrophosphorylase